MKALFYDGDINYIEDYPRPEIKKGESLIQVLVAAICNTDKEILKGYRPDFKGVLGHEFVGRVIESDNKELLNRRVVAEINESCGDCLYCNSGRASHCESRKVLGIFDKDGCFAEYIVVKNEYIHPIPDELDTEMAIFTEPLAAALRINEECHIKPSSKVAIIGDGRLAYMIAQTVYLTGADLTVIGRHDDKLEIFKDFAKVTKNPNESYEIVIDASGSPSGIILAKDLVQKMGTIVLKTTYAGEVSLNMSDIVVDEITIKGSRCGPFEPAIKLLSKGLISFPKIDLYELKDYEKAFESSAFKAGFKINY